MKIRDYKLFLEKDNVRRDEDSHLNDDLNRSKNKKRNESRWPEEEEYDYDDDSTLGYSDDGDDSLWGRPHYSKPSDSLNSFRDNEFDNEHDSLDGDDSQNDDVEHLTYLLRTMYKNSGIDEVYVKSKGLDITISCTMRRKERLKDIIKVLDVSNKLKRDILSQYDSEFEMFETRDGRPMMTFNFYYGDGLDDDDTPF